MFDRIKKMAVEMKLKVADLDYRTALRKNRQKIDVNIQLIYEYDVRDLIVIPKPNITNHAMQTMQL